MAKGKGGGGSATLLIIILALAGGLGAWNYQRNLALESQQREGARPFQGYSDEALEELAAAYSEEADIHERKYKASLERRTGVRDADGLLMEKVDEFERVRKIGDSIRVATSQVADSQARLRQIRDEQSWRRNESQWTLHLKRLTSI